MNNNEVKLLEALKASKNIVLVGEGQYVDSDTISSLASQAGYETLDVLNLQTATLAADGGVTISRKYDPEGKYIGKSFRDQWVKKLEDKPNQKFVVVLHYADPVYVYDKVNYLPWLHSILNHNICGDHICNYIVIALVWSQDKLGQLGGCFDETIVWSMDDSVWNTFFDTLHKEYDGIYGKDMIDCLYKLTPYLNSPSLVEEKLIKFIDRRSIPNECHIKTIRESSVIRQIKDCLNNEYKDYELHDDLKCTVDQLLIYIIDYLDAKWESYK